MRAPKELGQYRELISLVDERNAAERTLARYLRRAPSLDHSADETLRGYTDVIRGYLIERFVYGGGDGLEEVRSILGELRPEYDHAPGMTREQRAHARSLLFRPDDLYTFLTGKQKSSKRSSKAKPAPAEALDPPALAPSPPQPVPAAAPVSDEPVSSPEPVQPQRRRLVQHHTFEPLTYTDNLPDAVYQTDSFPVLLRNAVHYRAGQFPGETDRILRPEYVALLRTRRYEPEFVTELATSLGGDPERFLAMARASSHHEPSSTRPRRARRQAGSLDDRIDSVVPPGEEPDDEEGTIEKELGKKLE